MAGDVEETSSDDVIEHVYNYKTKSEYPLGASESKKRAIRKKATKFVVKDGELYYIQGQTKHKVSTTLNGFINTVLNECIGGKTVEICIF